MMKGLILTLLFSSLANAQHFDNGVIHLLDDMNKGKFLDGSSKVQCLPESNDVVTNRIKDSRAMNDCVVALCGVPTENKSVYLTNNNFNQYVTKETKKKVNALVPKLNKLFDKIQKNNASMIKELEKTILKNGLVKSNPGTWSEEFQTTITKAMFEPYLDVAINLSRPIGERLQLKIDPPKDASADFLAELREYAQNYAFYLNNNANQFMEKGLYSEAEMLAIGQERFKKIQQLVKVSPLIFRDDERASLAEFEKSLEIQDSLPVFTSLEAAEAIVVGRVPEYKKYTTAPKCSDKNRCEGIYNSYLNNEQITKNVLEFKKNLSDPVMRKRSMDSCKAQIIAAATISTDKNKANKLVTEVKGQINSKVFSKFSAHSRGVLKNYFDTKIKTSHNTPKLLISSDDPLMGFKRKIDNYLADEIEPFESSEESALERVLAISANTDNLDSFFAEGSPCGTMGSNAWDSYLAYDKVKKLPFDTKSLLSKIPPHDHIFISDFTCHQELRGKSIVAHELGHAINQIFSDNNLSTESAKFYKSIRQCATDNYTDFMADKTFFSQPGDGVKTEEDTADLFAYMSYPEVKDLFSCSLIKPSLNNSSYSELSFLQDDDDSHSTPLYRLVLEAINKDMQLPVSCQQALSSVNGKLRLKKCIP